MMTPPIATVIKMMEALPEAAQNQVAEHLRQYIQEMQDELQWNVLFEETQKDLIEAARQARQEIAEGHAKPMDYGRL